MGTDRALRVCSVVCECLCWLRRFRGGAALGWRGQRDRETAVEWVMVGPVAWCGWMQGAGGRERAPAAGGPESTAQRSTARRTGQGMQICTRGRWAGVNCAAKRPRSQDAVEAWQNNSELGLTPLLG
jgi:hypothetical protein